MNARTTALLAEIQAVRDLTAARAGGRYSPAHDAKLALSCVNRLASLVERLVIAVDDLEPARPFVPLAVSYGAHRSRVLFSWETAPTPEFSGKTIEPAPLSGVAPQRDGE